MSFPVKLPQFSGENSDTWKSYKANIELAYAVAGVDTTDSPLSLPQKAAHLLHGLTGKAKRFLELHPELRGKSYEEIDRVFSEKFGRPSAKGILDISSIVQKPKETVMEYLTRLKTAAEILHEDSFKPTIQTKDQVASLDPSEAKKLNIFTPDEYQKARNLVEDAFNKFLMPHFINGLRLDLKVVLHNSRPHTLDEAVEIAEEHETYTEQFGGLNMAGISMLQGQTAETQMITDVAEKLQGLNIKSNNDENAPHERYEGRQRPYNKDITCYSCGRTGHIMRECRRNRLQYYREKPKEADPRYRQYPAEHPLQEDPRPSKYDQPGVRFRDDRSETSGSPHMQRGLRNLRPQSAGRDRNSYPRIAGRSPGPVRSLSRDKGRPNKSHNRMEYPLVTYLNPKYAERNDSDDEEPAPRRSILSNKQLRTGEIHHKYGSKGRRRPVRANSASRRSASGNGERRPLGRGLPFPAPLRFMNLMQKH
jgi:hypothetical protein